MVSVLIVECDEATRSLAGYILQEHGFEVALAGNEMEALWRLRQSSTIDILFTELDLDGACGRELGSRARALQSSLRILYTGDPLAAGGLAGGGCHKTAFLPKIYSMSALVDAVTRLVEDDAGCTSSPRLGEWDHGYERPRTC